MTYQLTTFYCKRCKTGTPHELDGNGKAHCVPCGVTNDRHQEQRELEIQRETERHIAALDGFGPVRQVGNRGERRKTKR